CEFRAEGVQDSPHYRMASADPRHGDVLSHGHLFGLKTDVKSNVHFVDEHLVVYPCGHSVVFLHVESRAQQVWRSTTAVDSHSR
ncbi:unnamed protein product, partial [Hapterophycus canaliculatus]